MKKRLAASIISFCVALALLPATALAVPTTVTPDATSYASALMALDELEPAGFQAAAESELHPFGISRERSFTMLAEHEAFLLQSYDIDDNPETLYAYGSVNTSASGATLLEQIGGKLGSHALSYMEAVAFDPTGSGRDDHIAYVGFNPDSSCIAAWVLNTRTGRASAIYDIATAKWMSEDEPGQYSAPNFFSITAGDYDGDGIDTLMIYCCYDSAPAIDEFACTSTSDTLELSRPLISRALLHDGYVNYFQTMIQNDKPYYETAGPILNFNCDEEKAWMLGASLATGDFNGDGYEDLAALSYTNHLPNGVYYYSMYVPVLACALGGEGVNLKTMQDAVSSRRIYDTSGTTMANPSLAVGDIDGDGLDEMVMAGYYATLSTTGDGSGLTRDDNYYLRVAHMGYNPANNSFDSPTYLNVDITEGIQETADMADQSLPPIAAECVAINGVGSAEYVFIGHSLYSISGGSAGLQASLDGATIKNELLPVNLCPASAGEPNVVSSVAAGNFDGNQYGRETLLITLGCKEEGEDDYTYFLGSIGATYDSDGTPSYSAKFIECFGDKGDNHDEGLNCVIAAADMNDDGQLARFSEADFFYSDPNPMAVLQAAPWFGELGSWSDFQGGTSYGYSQSYTFGSSTTDSVSFSAGVIAELDAAVAEVSMEMGYSLDWNQTFEQSQSLTYETTFTAGPYDLVIISRTPVFTYYYDIY
ncbi:MAG: FG-GAP repeat protein, partial [Oscillospiraceae bacterium]|nr:FG-GAP repeat protein [Oscillospiraceae bacterium]